MKSLALSIDYLCVWLTVVLVLLNTTLILCCNKHSFLNHVEKKFGLVNKYQDILNIDFQSCWNLTYECAAGVTMPTVTNL